jgi:diguanylate cyclase (GGDEF)-like protein/PAS domain S-box-containing protein
MPQQLDLVFFIYGLAFLLLAGVCAGLWGQEREVLPWKWLALFGLIHGINEWLDLLALSAGDGRALAAVRLMTLAGSFLCLAEFGRVGVRAAGGSVPGRWALGLLVLLAAAVSLAGVPGPHAIRYALGLPGAVWAAAALWRAARSRNSGRGAMLAAAAAMAGYGIATGCLTPQAGHSPPALMSAAAFLHATGLPIQFLRGALACVMAGALWRHFEATHGTDRSAERRLALILAAALALVVGCGSYAAAWSGGRESERQTARLRDWAQRSAAAVAPENISPLTGSGGDRESPDYQSLQRQLQALRGTMPLVCRVYIVRLVRGHAVPLADSAAPAGAGEAARERACRDGPASLAEHLAAGDVWVEGPIPGREGGCYAAFCPVHDRCTGAVIATLGVEENAGVIEAAVARTRLRVIGLTALFCAAVVVGFAYRRRLQESLRTARMGQGMDPLLRWGPMAAVALMGTAVTLAVFFETRRVSIHSLETAFQQRAASRVQATSQALDNIVGQLTDLGRTCGAQPDFGGKDLGTWAGPVRESLGALALAWVPCVPEVDRAGYEARAQEEGLASWITQENAAGNLVPATDRPQYFPLAAVEPMRDDAPALGFDLGSDPTALAAMEAARDQGRPWVTAPVPPQHSHGGPTELVIFVPVYAGPGTPATVQARREGLRGFVAGLYSAEGLARSVLLRQPGEGLAFLVEDAGAPPQTRLLYRHRPRLGAVDWDKARRLASYEMPLLFAGRPWTITVLPGDTFIASYMSLRHWLILMMGLLASAALALYLGNLMTGRFQAEDLARRRTLELRLEKEHLNVTLRSIGDAVIATDAAGRVTMLNAVAEGLTGWPEAEAAGRAIEEVLHLVDETTRQPRACPVRAVIAAVQAVGLANHTVLLGRDGRECPIADSCAPICDERGVCLGAVMVFRDITASQEVQRKLKESEERHRLLFDESRDAMMTLAPPLWKFTSGNAAAVAMFGARDEADFTAHGPGEMSPEYQSDGRASGAAAREMIETAMGEGSCSFEWTHQRLSGAQFPALVLLSKLTVGGQAFLQCTVRDITERRRIEDDLRKLSRVVEQTPASVVITDMAGNIEYVNPAFTQITGYPAPEVLGKNPRLLKSGLMPADTYRRMWRELTSGREWRGELHNRRKNGALFWELAVISPLTDAQGSATHYLAIKEDITVRKQMEEQLRVAARTDRLTGLPNRELLLDRLQGAIERHRRSRQAHYAVLFLDCDRFKIVNDSLGHEVGDQLLCAVARRLGQTVRTVDSVGRTGEATVAARLGGDEFVILLDGLARPEDAQLVAERLLETLNVPYKLAGHDMVCTASVGIVTSQFGHARAKDVLRDADTAMYEAKLGGRGRAMVFDGSMRDRVRRKLELENGLRKALENGEFLLHYQPIVSLETRRVESLEALVRWQHPQHGMVPPGEFIPVAEETGLVIPLGEWVFAAACRQLAVWRRDYGAQAPPSISVNLSRNQLALPDLPQRLRDMAEQAGVEPQAVHLEITESAIMADSKAAAAVVMQLKQAGFKVDMDDFGTGYSSLACLHQFPIDVLKIDRSFVTNLERGRDLAALVGAIVTLAQNLGIAVVAEGVETDGQLAMLQAFGCQFAQGFYFARPLPPDQAGVYRADRAGAADTQHEAA